MPIARSTDPFVPKTVAEAMKLAKWRRGQRKAQVALDAARAAKAAPKLPIEAPEAPDEPWAEDAKAAPRPTRKPPIGR